MWLQCPQEQTKIDWHIILIVFHFVFHSFVTTHYIRSWKQALVVLVIVASNSEWNTPSFSYWLVCCSALVIYSTSFIWLVICCNKTIVLLSDLGSNTCVIKYLLFKFFYSCIFEYFQIILVPNKLHKLKVFESILKKMSYKYPTIWNNSQILVSKYVISNNTRTKQTWVQIYLNIYSL